jgi:hypothetical protein
MAYFKVLLQYMPGSINETTKSCSQGVRSPRRDLTYQTLERPQRRATHLAVTFCEKCRVGSGIDNVCKNTTMAYL